MGSQPEVGNPNHSLSLTVVVCAPSVCCLIFSSASRLRLNGLSPLSHTTAGAALSHNHDVVHISELKMLYTTNSTQQPVTLCIPISRSRVAAGWVSPLTAGRAFSLCIALRDQSHGGVRCVYSVKETSLA